jgi:tRNA A-37 threonylcarbamoyl transferase component Bud32
MPREVGQFTIQRVIGSGGMATVYAALQKQPRRTVALKVMKAGMTAPLSQAALRRFRREIEILGKLHHPYIAAVYDAGTFETDSGPAPYFVMEYIAGARNILEYVAHKELNLRDRLKLFVKVCAAVEHGHTHKVIHRDLKPGNILIDQYGEPKIIDFGIAHAAEIETGQQTMHTEAGRLVGTLQYMAPEQVDTRPQDLDGRCDVYALGVLLYKMVTGKPPYDLEALPVFEALRIIREERPRKPSEINSDVKGDLETIILKAMEHDRARRYRNAGSLGRDVVRFLANKPINARRASLGYRATLFAKRNAVVLSVVGVIALVAAGALGYVAWERMRLRSQQAGKDQEIQNRERDLAQRLAAATAASGSESAEPRREPFTLAQHTAAITYLRFVPSPGAHVLLVSASSDHQVMLWDIESRAVTQRIDPIGAAVTLLAVSADGSTLAAAGSNDGDPIAIVRCVDGQVVRTLRDLGGAVTALGLGPSGEIVAWGSSTLTLNLRPTDARGPLPPDNPRREPRSMRSASGPFTAIDFGRDDHIVAVGSAGGVVQVWEPREAPDSSAPRGRDIAAPSSPAGPVRLRDLTESTVALHFIEADAAPRLLVALAENGDAFTWASDKPGWQGAGWRAASKPVIAGAFDNSGTRLAVITEERVNVWTIDSSTAPPELIFTHTPEQTPRAVAIDDDGQWLALGLGNGDVVIVPVQGK